MALEIDLKDQVAMVTGVSSGIGFGIAKMLAKSGCDIIGCGLRDENTEGAGKFIAEVEGFNKKACYKSVDVRNKDELESFVKGGAAQFGKIDILVSNAGKNVFEGVKECSEEAWQHNLDLNLSAHWRLGKLAYPYLKASQNGTIIIMNSNHAFSAIEGCFPYNVAKTALRGLAQSMAIEWGPEIRTVGVAPGFVKTSSNEKWFSNFSNPEEERQRTIDLHPAGKIGSVEEIGAWCAFLASDYASFATGTTYLIDGGRSAVMQDKNNN
jgi:NAD(P)-dependent dehydrogenase (short-subunit alcohol dehydrogenase family)